MKRPMKKPSEKLFKAPNLSFFVPCPLRRGGYEGVHHTPSVIWFRAYSSTNLCMAFVSTGIRTPALVVRSQSSIHWATPQLALPLHTKKMKMDEKNVIN